MLLESLASISNIFDRIKRENWLMLSWQGRPERKPPDKTTTTKSSCLRTMLIFGLCAMQFFFVSRIDISRATVGFDDLIDPLVGKISSNDLQSIQLNESLAVNVRRKTSPSTLEEPRPKLKLFRNRLENSPNARKASQEVDVTSIISPSRGTLPISTQNATFNQGNTGDSSPPRALRDLTKTHLASHSHLRHSPRWTLVNLTETSPQRQSPTPPIQTIWHCSPLLDP